MPHDSVPRKPDPLRLAASHACRTVLSNPDRLLRSCRLLQGEQRVGPDRMQVLAVMQTLHEMSCPTAAAEPAA